MIPQPYPLFVVVVSHCAGEPSIVDRPELVLGWLPAPNGSDVVLPYSVVLNETGAEAGVPVPLVTTRWHPVECGYYLDADEAWRAYERLTAMWARTRA